MRFATERLRKFSRNNFLSALVSYLLYPMLYLGGLSALLAAGGTHQVIIVYAFIIAVVVVERISPYEPTWNMDDGQAKNDILWYATNWFSAPIALILTTTWLHLINSIAVSDSLRWWPDKMSWSLQIVLAILIYDFGEYIAHVLSHKISYLWSYHRIHHASKRLNMFNVARTHPIEESWHRCLAVTAPTLLGVPVELSTVFLTFATVGSILTHSNINMDCGLFNYVLSTPDLHRWHHSPNERETNTNYGRVTIVFDLIFGTYHHPRGPKIRKVGLDSECPSDFASQMLDPFAILYRKLQAAAQHLKARRSRGL